MSTSRALVCPLLIAAVFSSLSFAAAPDRILRPITSASPVTLPGGVNRKAMPQFDRGRVEPGLQFGSITLHMVPTAAQQKALNQLLAQQQDRKSANYHKWLTPEQWADQFGLSQNDIGQITAWLTSEGFTVRNVARGRNWITFSGSAAQVESAFGTQIHYFNVNGDLHVANATALRIPAALSGIVTLIRGLDDFHLRPRAKVHSNYFDSVTSSQYVAPGDIATIYDINPLYSKSTPIDGTGQKLAIIGQTDIYLADITDYRKAFGLSSISCTTNANGVVTGCSDPHLSYLVANGLTDNGIPLTTGDLSEADTDIEISGAVARNAQIVYVNAPATFNTQGGLVSGGVWIAWYYAVDNTVAPVMSMSYGNCEFGDDGIIDPSNGTDGPDETELKKANSEGITFVNSSGDSGAAECDPETGDPDGASAVGGIAVGYPASSPEVTGVGGTATPLADFTATYWNTANNTSGDGGSAISYVPEQTWNDDEEIAQYCTGQTSNLFCTQGGSTAVKGWVSLTSGSAKSAQEDLAIDGNGISSGGGGASNCATQNATFSACVSGFAQPSWQTVTITGQASARFSPDVSFLASPNFPGYVFCTELSELGESGTGSSCASGIPTAIESYSSLIGGTSVSSPLFAGVVTLLNQYLAASGGLGNINPTLYTVAATSANGAFHPITSGDNDVYCTAGQPSYQPTADQCPAAGVLGFSTTNSDSTNGYNLANGLGSVDVSNLATAWQAESSGTFSIQPSASSFQVAQGSNVNATIAVDFGSSFTGTVSFTCSDPAPASTCTPPGNVNKTGNVSFNITTTQPTAELRRPFDRGTRIFYATLLPGLFGIVLVAGSRKRLRGGIRMVTLIAALALSTVWMSSCGGSSSSTTSNPGTPAGTYTITVKGTSGSTTVSSSFQLVVQ